MKITIYLILFLVSTNSLCSQTYIKEQMKYYNDYDKKWYYNGKPFTGFVLLDRNKNKLLKDTIEYYDGKEQGLISMDNDINKFRYRWSDYCLENGYVILNNFRGNIKNNRPTGTVFEYYKKGEEFIDVSYNNGSLQLSGYINSNIKTQKLKSKYVLFKDTLRCQQFYTNGDLYKDVIYLVDTSFYDRIKKIKENNYYSDWFLVSPTLHFGNWIIGFDFEKYIKMNRGIVIGYKMFYQGKRICENSNYENGKLISRSSYLKNGKLLDSVRYLKPNIDFQPNYEYVYDSYGKRVDSTLNYEPLDCFSEFKYDMNGKLLSKTIKISGNKVSGTFYSYFNNGKIDRFYTLENGEGVAPSESYYENGIIKTKHYKEGNNYYYIENFPDGNQKIKIKTEYKLDRGKIVGLPSIL